MKLFICQECGHMEFNSPVDKCQICMSEKFNENNNVFKESEQKSQGKETSDKHVPLITISEQCGLIPDMGCVDIMVRIGKTLHPSEEKHFIQFIDCYLDDKFISRASLSPQVNPAACFHLKTKGKKVTIVENCNIHGYWIEQANL
jgi:desulfoferrodoxin-like iron-binding protein